MEQTTNLPTLPQTPNHSAPSLTGSEGINGLTECQAVLSDRSRTPLLRTDKAGGESHITFSGVCLQGKAKGTRIIGFGYYRKGDKHYVHGSDVIPGDIFDHDGWHLIDPETLSVVVAKY